MKGCLPNEIWLNIVDTLGLQGYTRDCTTLIRALDFNESLVYNYLITELYKTRWDYDYTNGSYEEQMLRFWEKTGIDDGVSPQYLLGNLNSHTKMYKTIWAASVFENKNGEYCLFPHILFDYIKGIYNYKYEYEYTVFKDYRDTPIHMIKSKRQLSEKSKEEMGKLLETLKSSNQLTLERCILYDRKKRLVLCKAKGSLI